VARLQVDEKGLVTNVTIVEANPRRVFDREVIRALSQWKFKPEGDRYIA
jgi:protein TonB